MTLTRSYQEYTSQFKRMDVAETIIAEHRVNGRRLLDIEALLLCYFANHCGPNLPDGWAISEDALAGRYGKSVVTISRAINTLRTEELINRKQAGRNPARYTLGRAFFGYVRLIIGDNSNGAGNDRQRQLEMTASDKSNVPDPYLTDIEHDDSHTPLQARTRVSESQKIMLEEMLEDRGMTYMDVVANSDRIPGLRAELPAELADLPRENCTPLMRWLKEQPKKPVQRREIEVEHDCRILAIGRRADADDVDLADCDNYLFLVVQDYAGGLGSTHAVFSRAALYHEHQLNLSFIDDMIEHYDYLGGRGAVLTEIDRALNRPGAKNAQDITLHINDWLSKEDRWKRERSSDERFGRDSSGHQGAGGSWGDTEAARLTRERIQNLPDMFGSGIDPERPES